MTQTKRTGSLASSKAKGPVRVEQQGESVDKIAEKISGRDSLFAHKGVSMLLSKPRPKFSQDPKTGEFQVHVDTGVIESLKASGFTAAEIIRYVVSKRSLERRQQKNQPLSASETDRALRLTRIHEHAMRVFGSREKAHRWLRKPCRALGGAIPMELLASETGAHLVESELHAIDHGIFA